MISIKKIYIIQYSEEKHIVYFYFDIIIHIYDNNILWKSPEVLNATSVSKILLYLL